MMLRILLFLLIPFCSFGQAYNIKVTIDNFKNDTLYLGNYFAKNQYLKDTAYFDGKSYVFDGDKPLEQGVYLLVLPPKNDIYEIIINEDQDFEISVDHEKGAESLKVKGSEENSSFQEYIGMIRTIKPRGEALRKEMEASEEGSKEYTKSKEQIENLQIEIDDLKVKLLEKHPKSVLSLLIKSSDVVDVPDFEEEKDEDKNRMLKYLYYKKHYFDAFDLSDGRLLRTPFFESRVEYYLEKLTPQSPDSISESIDFLLGAFEPNEELFKYHLIDLLNKYANSKVVGFDAVYVHLVQNYYAKGKAPWTKEEQLKKIVKNANTLEPLLIGKKAPPISVISRTGETVSLYDIKAEYTIMYFWDPECGHCKKSIPKALKFYEKFKDQGVEVLAICTRLTDKVPECWEATEERGMNIWINAADPYLRSRYKQIYNIVSTPMIFILDEDKVIVSKRIASTQLEEVITKLKEFKARDKENEGS